jgi:hypothetical protein
MSEYLHLEKNSLFLFTEKETDASRKQIKRQRFFLTEKVKREDRKT